MVCLFVCFLWGFFGNERFSEDLVAETNFLAYIFSECEKLLQLLSKTVEIQHQVTKIYWKIFIGNRSGACLSLL